MVKRYSFIPAISIAHRQVPYYSEALPTTARILYRSFSPKRHRQLQVKDLPNVPTWQPKPPRSTRLCNQEVFCGHRVSCDWKILLGQKVLYGQHVCVCYSILSP